MTLIELLVVVAVIAVLLSITISAVGVARRAAQQAGSLSNLRGIGALFQSYHTQERYYPFGRSSYQPSNPDVLVILNVFLLDSFWPLLLQDFAPWAEYLDSWVSPGRQSPGAANAINNGYFFPSYFYSTSFVASPKLWDGRTVATEEEFVRPTRAGEVSYPSLKVLAYDRDRAYLSDPTDDSPRPLLFADGSARARPDNEAHPPVPNPLARSPPMNRPPTLYQDTKDGVKGRDF